MNARKTAVKSPLLYPLVRGRDETAWLRGIADHVDTVHALERDQLLVLGEFAPALAAEVLRLRKELKKAGR